MEIEKIKMGNAKSLEQEAYEEKLNETPFYKENKQRHTAVGTGFYYSDLLEYYHEKYPKQTSVKEGTSFNRDETTIILDTGKYSYEYDHSVGIIDKINNSKELIEENFESGRSPKLRQSIEKDIISEIEKESTRSKQRKQQLMKEKLIER